MCPNVGEEGLFLGQEKAAPRPEVGQRSGAGPGRSEVGQQSELVLAGDTDREA